MTGTVVKVSVNISFIVLSEYRKILISLTELIIVAIQLTNADYCSYMK